MGIQDEVIDWMADGRLDRLERQAKSGYASPEQMLKLIAEVRRRRAEERRRRDATIRE